MCYLVNWLYSLENCLTSTIFIPLRIRCNLSTHFIYQRLYVGLVVHPIFNHVFFKCLASSIIYVIPFSCWLAKDGCYARRLQLLYCKTVYRVLSYLVIGCYIENKDWGYVICMWLPIFLQGNQRVKDYYAQVGVLLLLLCLIHWYISHYMRHGSFKHPC